MGCERCERRDELDYCNLDDREKYFLMFMVDGFEKEMIIPGGFLKRFKGDIPAEIKLETGNSHSYTVGVAKYADKLVLAAGWGAFVETYDLGIHDSVVFRYKGNSQFIVIVFDQFGLEKASSVVADNAPLSPDVQERKIGATGAFDCSHGLPQPMEMESPTVNVNHSQEHPHPVQMQSSTRSVDHFISLGQAIQMQLHTAAVNHSNCHPETVQMQLLRTEKQSMLPSDYSNQGNNPQPMDMESPTVNVNYSQQHPRPVRMQSPTETVDHVVRLGQAIQMEPHETVNHSNYHPESVQMQLPRTEKQFTLPSYYSNQGNNTAASYSSDDDIEARGTPSYMVGSSTHLNPVQKKKVEEKIQSIHSDNPIFVAMMRKCNVTGAFTLCLSNFFGKTYVGDPGRCISLQRYDKNWEVRFGRRPTEKRIVGGWGKFVKDNDVKMGDICIFELIKNCKMCTMEVHIIHEKDFDMASLIGCEKVKKWCREETNTADHSHSRLQLMQMQFPTEAMECSHVHEPMEMQSPSTKRHMSLQKDNSPQGDKVHYLSTEDSDHEVDIMSGFIAVHVNCLTPIQKKAVEQKVQYINSEIPVFVIVMQKTAVTGRFTFNISKKYAEKYLGDEVQSIWLERLGKRCQVRLGKRPRRMRIASGWSKFVQDNEVEMGDICLFELLKHRKVCTMKVHIIRQKHVS